MTVFKMNKLVKNISIYISSDILNKMVPFLLLPILTRYLTPSDYGIISMFFVLTSVLGIVMTIETNTAIGVFFFKKSHEELKIFIANVIMIISVLTTISLVFSIIFEGILSKLLALDLMWVIMAVVVTFAQFLTTINLVLWQSEHNAVPTGIYQVSQTLINLGLSLVLIIGLKMGWEGRLLAISFSSIVFGIYSFRLLFKRDYVKIKYDEKSWKEIYTFCIPLLPHALSIWFKTGIDRIFLTSLMSPAATGIYSVSFQIASILYVLCVALNKAFAPYLYSKLNNMDDYEKLKHVKYFYLYFLALAVVALLVSVTAPYIIKYFLGEAFVESQKYIALLAFSFAFQGMYLMVVNFVLYMKKTAFLSYITISISILHIILCYLLIKMNGISGASQAALITSILTFISVWWLSNKVYTMPWGSFLRVNNV